MSQDGAAPLHQAIRRRQVPSAGLLSTVTTPTPTPTLTTSHQTDTTIVATAAAVTSALFSTVTTDYDFDGQTCTAALPSGGIIEFNETYNILLEQSVSFVAVCGNYSIFKNQNSTGSNATVLGPEPFYASIESQIYALATATVISYVLVILIFITPRTFYINGPAGSSGISGSASGLRTLIPGSAGRNGSVIGIGSRPLLQKIAALTVAASLTIATTDTFHHVEQQYNSGFLDSKDLVSKVVGSTEIKVTHIISDTFLWLAQVQTLIRLFPRHKEKVTIKWLGFGLVLFDTVFSILQDFVYTSSDSRPGTFTDAIPTLSYLFDLSIGLIYASCVLYYALSKRRFAFWHAKMRNICLVALISIIAVLIPVVFFITDLAQPDIADWGEYIRWVGAAAASVVVWEWVERIEALERDDKKDGILGREIFDGDEMLEMTPTEDGYDQRRFGRSDDSEGKRSRFWSNVRDLHVDVIPRLPSRIRRRKTDKKPDNEEKSVAAAEGKHVKSVPNQISRPPQAITPISRSDTNSAASTVYAVRYHDPFSPSPAIPEEPAIDHERPSSMADVPPAISDESTLTNSTNTTIDPRKEDEPSQGTSTGRQLWQGVTNPFKRKRAEPPAEVAAQITESNSRRSPSNRPDLKNRINAFTTAQRARMGLRAQKSKSPPTVTFIPSQPRASRAKVSGENTAAGRIDSVPETQSSSTSNDSRSDTTSPDPASLPVTFIPPPIRGGRTWSPDDLKNNKTTSSTPVNVATSNEADRQPLRSTPVAQDVPGVSQWQRGSLTISESPGRLRDGSTPSNSTPSGIRRSRTNRSVTIESISDRLDSSSPAVGSYSPAPRSNTADSTGPRGPSGASTDRKGRQASG